MPDCSTLIPVKRLRRKADWQYCHKCPHNQEGDTACLSCPGPSELPNNHGKNHVSLDIVDGFMETAGGVSHEGEQGHTPAAFLQDPGTPGEPGQVDDETFAQFPPEACAALRTFFGEWLRMGSTARDALAIRIADPQAKYPDIAKKLGITMQAVHAAMRSAAGGKCRALACLIFTKNAPRHVRGNLNTTAFRALVLDIAREHCPLRKSDLVQLVRKATGSQAQSQVMVGRLVNEGSLIVSGGEGFKPNIISLPGVVPGPAPAVTLAHSDSMPLFTDEESKRFVQSIKSFYQTSPTPAAAAK